MKSQKSFGWSEYPFLRLCLPLLLGFIFFDFFDLYKAISVAWIFAFCAVVFLFIFIGLKQINYRFRWLVGFVFFMSVFSMGGVLLRLHDVRLRPDYFQLKDKSNGYLIASLDEAPRATRKGLRCILRLEQSIHHAQVKSVSGNVMTYFLFDSIHSHLKYGDRILFRQDMLHEVAGPMNPGGFDYKSYLAQKQVYYICSLNAKSWRRIPGNTGNRLVAFSIQLRDGLLDIYRKNGIVNEQFGVLAALVLGYTQDIDNELTSAYAAAGVTHVLSVSGMHVGLIYILLTHLLSFLGLASWARVLRAMILLAFLWFYALLTGLSPAVLRAATMLSLIVVGKAWKRQENTLNTVAASAFLLLLFDPWLMYDIGFQLSYLAVCGIVLVHPFIYDWFSPERYWLDQVWSLVSVSLAAQLTTCIPAIYYFHQFPLLFLITNILVIPLSTLIIYGGIALLVFSPVTVIAHYTGIALNNMIYALNSIVCYVQKLPFALLDQLWIGRSEVALLHLSLVALVVYLITTRVKHLMCFLLSLFLLLSIFVYRFSTYKKQGLAIVYTIKGHTAIDFIQGQKHVLLTNLSLDDTSHVLLRNVKPTWGMFHLTELHMLHTGVLASHGKSAKLRLLHQQDRSWLFVSGDFRRLRIAKDRAVRVDYLIMHKNPKVAIRDLLCAFKPRMIVADGSSNSFCRKRWRVECSRLGMPYRDVVEEGALLLLN